MLGRRRALAEAAGRGAELLHVDAQAAEGADRRARQVGDPPLSVLEGGRVGPVAAVALQGLLRAPLRRAAAGGLARRPRHGLVRDEMPLAGTQALQPHPGRRGLRDPGPQGVQAAGGARTRDEPGARGIPARLGPSRTAAEDHGLRARRTLAGRPRRAGGEDRGAGRASRPGVAADADGPPGRLPDGRHAAWSASDGHEARAPLPSSRRAAAHTSPEDVFGSISKRIMAELHAYDKVRAGWSGVGLILPDVLPMHYKLDV